MPSDKNQQGNNLHKTKMSGEFSITKILEKKHGLKRSIYIATPALEENNGSYLYKTQADQCSNRDVSWLPSEVQYSCRPVVHKGNSGIQDSMKYEIVFHNEKPEIKKSTEDDGKPFRKTLSTKQLSKLEAAFQDDPYPSVAIISFLADSTGLSKTRIKVGSFFFSEGL